MKTLGISIDWVLRDFQTAFEKQYKKVFINNPNIVGMNTDMTVKERTEEEWKELEKEVEERERELISLPMDSYNLNNHYKFEDTIALDGETVLSPQEALEEFISKYHFNVYGQAVEYENACDAVNRIQAHGLRSGTYKTVIITSIKSPGIPATFHFLAKNASRVRNVMFVDEDYQKWDHCDVMIDCIPEVVQNVPKGKTILKIEQDFNKWDKVEHSFKSVKEIDISFLDTIFPKALESSKK